jgi:nickel-dependent lactate racemase
MWIEMPYGDHKLGLNLADIYDVSVIEPVFVPAIPDAKVGIRAALRNPVKTIGLADRVCPTDQVGIIFSDITRPAPNRVMLPEILAELAFMPKKNITLFNALGTHRKNTHEELCYMLGEQIVRDYRIVQNEAFVRSTQVFLGKTKSGNEIRINRELMECNLKVLTGFIEPHFFAGFSGGGKAIMPGMAGLETILGNHNAELIAHPRARWGITEGNPIFEEIEEIAEMAGNLFLVNVTLNKHKEITGVFCGDLWEAHAQGCAYVKEKAMVPVEDPFDIVITTNSGYPLDLNLYQSVKGMSAAAGIVKQSGTIIIATECRDGIPEHGMYRSLLGSYETPGELLEGIQTFPENRHDQWQAQIQALIQLKANVYVYSDGLTEAQIRSMMLEPVRDIEGLVKAQVGEIGRAARICVLPEGPQTIPYIKGQAKF